MSDRTIRAEIIQDLQRLRGSPVGMRLSDYLYSRMKAVTELAMTTQDEKMWHRAKGSHEELKLLLQIVDPIE